MAHYSPTMRRARLLTMATCAWTTTDELNAIREMAVRGNQKALNGWLHAARNHFREWGRIDREACIRYAESALEALAEGRTVPGPHGDGR